MDREWEEIQKQILSCGERILLRIEWEYGECRAPFKYPPHFERLTSGHASCEYLCRMANPPRKDLTLAPFIDKDGMAGPMVLC